MMQEGLGSRSKASHMGKLPMRYVHGREGAVKFLEPIPMLVFQTLLSVFSVSLASIVILYSITLETLELFFAVILFSKNVV